MYVPHYYGLGLIDWSLSVDPVCGDAVFYSLYNAFQIAFNIFKCNIAGTYKVKVSFENTNIDDNFLPSYTIISRAFEKLTLSLIGLSIKSIDQSKYLVQSISDVFPIDLITNNTISFNVTSSDIYDNLFNL